MGSSTPRKLTELNKSAIQEPDVAVVDIDTEREEKEAVVSGGRKQS